MLHIAYIPVESLYHKEIRASFGLAPMQCFEGNLLGTNPTKKEQREM